LEIVRRPLLVRGLPPALAGRTLAHLSDIHVSPFVSDEYLLETFRRVADLQPDIVVITGDLMSWHPGWRDHVAAIYQHAPRGRLATIATLGNHDYGPAWADPVIAASLVDVVRSCGITVLRNEMFDAGGLQIVGLDDLWSKRFDPKDVLSRLDRSRGSIALSHNPDTVDLPVWGDYQGWILAGHTHGGQCKPPFLPPPVLPVKNRRYTAGEFQLAGNRQLYISRGVGHSFPVRFNVRPEVTLFTLT
jgi:predicted MPP superfamily phosphohydrolase